MNDHILLGIARCFIFIVSRGNQANVKVIIQFNQRLQLAHNQQPNTKFKVHKILEDFHIWSRGVGEHNNQISKIMTLKLKR